MQAGLREKGGPGKTTTALNVVVAHAQAGRDVILVDADPMRSLARWHSDRAANGVQPAIACVEKLGALHETLADLDERYEIVVVDVAGRDSREMRTAMTIADQVILVTRPSQFDLDTLDHLNDVLSAARDLNPSLAAYGLLSQVPTDVFATELTAANAYFEDFEGIALLNTVIRTRKAYRDVISEGKGVVEWNNVKARNEILELVAELNHRATQEAAA